MFALFVIFSENVFSSRNFSLFKTDHVSTSIVNNILCPSEIWGGKTAAEHLMNVFHFPRELQFPLLSLLKSCGNSIISCLCAECICDNYAASDD